MWSTLADMHQSCTRFGSAVADIESMDPDAIVCKPVAVATANVLNPQCEFDVSGAFYKQQDAHYPACPAGASLFGLSKGGFCCTGTCAPGHEGDDANDAICAMAGNPLPGVHATCTGAVQTSKFCMWAYSAPEATALKDFTMKTKIHYDGEAAGLLFRMADGTDASSARYWVKMEGGSVEKPTAGLWYFDGTDTAGVEIGARGDISISYASGYLASKPAGPSASSGLCDEWDVTAEGALHGTSGSWCSTNCYVTNTINTACSMTSEDAPYHCVCAPRPTDNAFAAAIETAVAAGGSGYCTKANVDLVAFRNSNVCTSGSVRNIAFQITINFNAPADGEWQFDFNVDFGWGGLVQFDGVDTSEGYQGGNMWWNNGWSRPQPLDTTHYLTAGQHTMVVYGAEGCCDGTSNIRFKAPDDMNWRYLSLSELEKLTPARTTLESGRMYDVELRVIDDSFTLLLDDDVEWILSDSNIAAGTVGLQTWKASMVATNLQLLSPEGLPLYQSIKEYKGMLASKTPWKMYIDGTKSFASDYGSDAAVPVHFSDTASMLALALAAPPKPAPVPTPPRQQNGCFAGGPSKAAPSTCRRQQGFCVYDIGRRRNRDQNRGVYKLNSLDGNKEKAQCECIDKCRAWPGATGCEVIWNQRNRGCYVHTQKVQRGNRRGNHYCWIFTPSCKGDMADTAPPPLPQAFAMAASYAHMCQAPSDACQAKIRWLQDNWATDGIFSDGAKAAMSRRGLTDDNYLNDLAVQRYIYNFMSSDDVCNAPCPVTSFAAAQANAVISSPHSGWKCVASADAPSSDASGKMWYDATYDHSSWNAMQEVMPYKYPSTLGPVSSQILSLAPAMGSGHGSGSGNMPVWLGLESGCAQYHGWRNEVPSGSEIVLSGQSAHGAAFSGSLITSFKACIAACETDASCRQVVFSRTDNGCFASSATSSVDQDGRGGENWDYISVQCVAAGGCIDAAEFDGVKEAYSWKGTTVDADVTDTLSGHGFDGRMVNSRQSQVKFSGITIGGSTALTVSMWIRLNNNKQDFGWFSYGAYTSGASAEGGLMCQIRVRSGKKDIHCRYGSAGAARLSAADSPRNTVRNKFIQKWTHVAVTFTGGSNIKYYLDGKNVGTTAVTLSALPTASDGFAIGGWPNDNWRKYLNGKVDLVRVWTSVKSDDEMKALYMEQKNMPAMAGCRKFCVTDIE